MTQAGNGTVILSEREREGAELILYFGRENREHLGVSAHMDKETKRESVCVMGHGLHACQQ